MFLFYFNSRLIKCNIFKILIGYLILVVMVAYACTASFTPPPTFKADHPFIVILQSKHQESKLVLFTGKLMKPKI